MDHRYGMGIEHQSAGNDEKHHDNAANENFRMRGVKAVGRKIFFIFIACFIAGGSAQLASSGQNGLWVGGGITTSPIPGELRVSGESLGNVSRMGFHGMCGYRFSDVLSLNIGISLFPISNPAPADEWGDESGGCVLYSIMMLGVEVDFRSFEKRAWTPWLSFDVAEHTILPEGWWVFPFSIFLDQWGSGAGFSPAAGLDIRLDKAALIRGGYRLYIARLDFPNLGDELDLFGHTLTTSLCIRF
jgi:hypothetical protein